MTRRAYIDWLRGVAVLCMVEWHSLDSWTLPSARETGAFHVVAVIGGWAAPLFLFLAGVSLPLAGAARMRRGANRAAASRALQRRGWFVFLIAHLFRLQSFLLNPHAAWSSVLKPDILNVLGLGLVAAAFGWGRATTPARAVGWLAAPALLCVAITPWAAEWIWPSLLYPRFEAYIRPVGNLGVFAIFPWVGYVLAGACLGLMVLPARDGRGDAVFHARLAATGAAVAAAAFLVPLPQALSTFTLRVGEMLVMLAVAWWWMRSRAGARSPLVLFGRTSLFVYWVHVELAYGVFSRPLHKALPLPSAVAAFAIFTLLMLAAAAAWSRLRRVPRDRDVETGTRANRGPTPGRSSV